MTLIPELRSDLRAAAGRRDRRPQARWSKLRRPRLVIASGGLALAGAVTAIVLAVSATSVTPPAYAYTTHPNGSITVTLRDVATGIPALNAKLREAGIPSDVIPITAGCNSPDGSGNLVMHPDPHLEYSGSVSMTYTPQAARRHPAPRGFHYVLAAKQMPNGKILAFIGALKSPVPTCLPYDSTPSKSLVP